MSDNQYSDILDDDEEVTEVQEQNENGPKALRDALKKEAQRRKELETELETIRSTQRKAEVEKALADAGLPKEAAKFAKDADDINAWITEHRGLFGVAGASEPEVVDDGEPKGEPNLSEEERAEIMGVQGLVRNNFTGGSAASVRLDEATSTATSLTDAIGKVNAALKSG